MIERALCPTLIGRQHELSILESALFDLGLDEGGVVVLTGEAGVGKSRLAAELRGIAAKLGYVVLWGSCSEAELSVPYLPFLEALGNHLAPADLAHIRQRAGPAARDLARLLPQLGVEPATSKGEDPTQAKLRTYESVLSLLGILSEPAPLVLVLEDVHWADASTHELIDYVARRVHGASILLVVTYRREEVGRRHRMHPTIQGWRRGRLATVVELAPLRPTQVAEMASAIFDEAAIGSEFRDYLHRRSEGNPFVLEEMLKDAIDRGDVFRSETGWERRSIADLCIPETVRDTILTRLERLDGSARDVLRTAAVIGSSFGADVLARLCALHAGQLDEVMRACLHQQFLEMTDRRGGAYRFRHSVTWETIYDDIASPLRTRLHDRAAEVLEGLDGPPAELAFHLAAAGRVGEAVPLWISAAEAAVRKHAYTDAAELYRRALQHIEDALARARAQAALGDALWRAGPAHMGEAITNLKAAVEALADAGADREAAAHRILLGRCQFEADDHAAAREAITVGAQTLERMGPSEELAIAYLHLCGMEYEEGDMGGASALAQRAIDTATAAGADAARIWGYGRLGSVVAEEGRIQEGLALLERSYREALEHDYDVVATNSLNNCIGVLLELTRAQECRHLVETMRCLPNGFASAKAQSWDGLICECLGELDRAAELLRETVDTAAIPAHMVDHCKLHLALVLTELGRGDEAQRWLIPPNRRVDRRTFVEHTMTSAHIELANGMAEAAVIALDRVVTVCGGLPPGRFSLAPEFADTLVAALLETGRTDRATTTAADIGARQLSWSPLARRAQARVLIGNDSMVAQALLATIADEFEAAGYRIAEVETRLLRAEALMTLDDADAAVAELRTAWQTAHDCNAVRLMGALRHKLAALGRSEELGEPIGRRALGTQPSAALDHHRLGEHAIDVCALHVRARLGTTTADPDPLVHGNTTLRRWADVVVKQRHGVVDSTSDEDIVITFDVSSAPVDGCVDALRTAVGLREKAALQDLPVMIGIGVGSSVDGSSAPAPEHRAVARAASLAFSLQAAPTRGAIALSDDAYRTLRPWLESRRLQVTRLAASGRAGATAGYVLDHQRKPRPADSQPSEGTPPGERDRTPMSPSTLGEPDQTAQPNVFRCEGDYWSIGYRETVIRVKDSKGLRDLAVLLAHPGREVAAIELVSGAGSAKGPRRGTMDDGMGTEVGVGLALDAEAREQYRERLVDLEDEIDSAQAANDPERAVRGREEREFLLAELSAAVGIGGRGRSMLDPAERARKTVTWRIRESIARIGAADRLIGDHLRRSVRTGTFCVYDPADPTGWNG